MCAHVAKVVLTEAQAVLTVANAMLRAAKVESKGSVVYFSKVQ